MLPLNTFRYIYGLEDVSGVGEDGHVQWLGHDRSEEIAGELKKVPLAPCAMPEGTVLEYLR